MFHVFFLFFTMLTLFEVNLQLITLTIFLSKMQKGVEWLLK